MTLYKSGGRFPYETVTVIERLRAVLSSIMFNKLAIFVITSHVSGDIPVLANKLHTPPKIMIDSSKHFLGNACNDSRICDINFIFKRGAQNDTCLNLGIVIVNLSVTQFSSANASSDELIL
jgi:hypothetical protein